MEYYVCKRIKLMSYLQKNGYDYVSVRRDRKNPNFLVWIYPKTSELMDCVDEYYRMKE